MKLLIEQNEDGDKRRNAAKKKELEAAEKRIGELSAIFKRLYEDSVSGRISDERFTELSADYEAEQKELKERVARTAGRTFQSAGSEHCPPQTLKSLEKIVVNVQYAKAQTTILSLKTCPNDRPPYPIPKASIG